MRYSIKTKYTVTLFAAVLLASILVGVSSAYFMTIKINSDTDQILNLNCREDAEIVNDALNSTKQTVEVMAEYASQFDFVMNDLVEEESLRADYMDKVRRLFARAARESKGAVTYYLRFNPKYFPPDEGFLYTKAYGKNTLGDVFTKIKPTDFSEFDEDDPDVAWFYRPVKERKGMWSSPYWGENLQFTMISYVTPIIIEGVVIGAVGMDIVFDSILERVYEKKSYQSGFALLISEEGEAFHVDNAEEHPDVIKAEDDVAKFIKSLDNENSGSSVLKYNFNGVDKRIAYYTLKNGMVLVVSVDASEFTRDRNMLVAIAAVIILCSALLFSYIGYQLASRITEPLLELTSVASDIAAGNIDAEVPEVNTGDEIEELTTVFRITTQNLRKHIKFVQSLAYEDALTGVRNKAAYNEVETELNQHISDGSARFALLMIDLNRLKKINDNYGHENGNKYIINLCNIIVNYCDPEFVYRIGGDEFVVLLKGHQFALKDEIEARLKEEFANKDDSEKEPWENVSAAVGSAVFDPITDEAAADVFNRADEDMYKNKIAMKAESGTKRLVEDIKGSQI